MNQWELENYWKERRDRGDIGLVGLAEIAEIAGVRNSAVSNWMKRHSEFPKPIATLKCGPIFQKHEILDYLDEKQRGSHEQGF